MEREQQRLLRKKNRFVLYAIIFAFAFYFMLPVSFTLFPDRMNRPSILPWISWAWLYAFLQILMIWLLGWLYHSKMKKLDRLVERLKREEQL